MQNQQPELSWRDGDVPVSLRFDDPYFSLENGLAETRHVFLSGNDLPDRFRDGFQIAELGFGTGLNLLTAWAAWERAGCSGRLNFTSFEAFPMDAAQMARALQAFPEVAPWRDRFLTGWAGSGGYMSETLRFELIVGDARKTLPEWEGQADAWFLDGFSPARNPELWGAKLLADVGRHTAPAGTLATYTAAGQVRRALQAAGFLITRVPGYGRKRHMTRGALA